MNYFALIGDIIDSKKINNRYQVQKTLESCLKQLNANYSSVVVSKMSITLGDEFQGLLSLDAPLFQIIDCINVAMQPYQIRFGLGLGTILTDINPEQSIGADGPAYWYARKALQYIHQKNDYGTTQIAVHFEGGHNVEVINTLIASGEAIKASWRASQEIILQKLLENDIYHEAFDQQALAKELDLTTSSALSKRLKSSNIKVYLRTRNCALKLLKYAGEE
ncbi:MULTISPECIES: SatD family protein [unclassified Streptococcus]|uniref:SatD family protein n=1 Tax=unclassified Streptococcus TaxID=2608887 RepID=UPI001071DEB6|nr:MULTISPECIES: SatD family protein [unclassified Streptococcus]MBF0786435.1 DNA-binding protein [Streptococcus sp. 19428wC2_LYSM12]MCQ9212542.1 SatD family protein [Streptococcus sp. B01]MCQ9213881.1 SatD family protein [Streptococcus sp. O1]TFV06843.1 DNA-binding protein [Streptococcus sp. LYSM12]